MDISIGSYKMRLEILLLFIIISWIMFGHMLCSCCNIKLNEGFTIQTTIGQKSEMNNKEGMSNMNYNNKIEGNNVAYEPELAASKSHEWIMNPKNWGKKYQKSQKQNVSMKLEGMCNKTDSKNECCRTNNRLQNKAHDTCCSSEY